MWVEMWANGTVLAGVGVVQSFCWGCLPTLRVAALAHHSCTALLMAANCHPSSHPGVHIVPHVGLLAGLGCTLLVSCGCFVCSGFNNYPLPVAGGLDSYG
jgi:hypothetical protein